MHPKRRSIFLLQVNSSEAKRTSLPNQSRTQNLTCATVSEILIVSVTSYAHDHGFGCDLCGCYERCNALCSPTLALGPGLVGINATGSDHDHPCNKIPGLGPGSDCGPSTWNGTADAAVEPEYLTENDDLGGTSQKANETSISNVPCTNRDHLWPSAIEHRTPKTHVLIQTAHETTCTGKASDDGQSIILTKRT